MSEYKIESGIPIPGGRRQAHNKKYPWNELDVGQSFFVPGVAANNFASQASRAGKTYGRRFVVRSMDGGIRVWRVK